VPALYIFGKILDRDFRMQPAYYAASLSTFFLDDPDAILGQLTQHAQDVAALQRYAWVQQIAILQPQLAAFKEGAIALEFSIPRMGKRVDVVIILAGIVFLLEFKVGENEFTAATRDQVMDYALDLKNFHAGSHTRRIVPIIVATKAPTLANSLLWSLDGIADTLLCNSDNLGAVLTAVIQQSPKQDLLDYQTWAASGYRPTPTIIEAAQALYSGHHVEEITRSDAGAKNLSETTACLAHIIETAKAKQHKAICFVTGVPGAGKTLAGLNLVTHRTQAHDDEHAVFLSGNDPLVEVLREALARDEIVRLKEKGQASTKADATRKVKTFIQNIHHFRDANLVTEKAPIEHVSVFDEAQRAWDKAHASNFMAQKKGVPDFAMSEPEFLISVMDRHPDWCTIVCLVGGGQEINAGEAGLTEWFIALRDHFPNWKVFTSPQLTHPDYDWGHDLSAMLQHLDHRLLPDLHLAVSVRSFRAEKLSDFVGALIAGEADVAWPIHDQIKAHYPIWLTRDLTAAKNWLRSQARGSERFGFVASSGASRLKPEGLNVHEKITATYWFLNEKSDVRSCYYLEDPATEFDTQGLELDWVGVCWDADYRRVNGNWAHYQFRGTAWQNVKNESQRTYLANAYRVLLTRARQGMVIYVPEGDSNDPTRQPAFYHGVVAFLKQCGIEEL
jgi:hypothetical protein